MLDLATLILDRGAHRSFEEGACLLEAASFMAGERFSDHPKCVSPVLGVYGRALNDVLPIDHRQELKQYLPRLLNTAGDGLDETRSYIALDWLIRTYTPAFLDLAGLTVGAQELRSLRGIVDGETANAAGLVVRNARMKAAVARGASWDDAVWDAVGDAAWDAAWDAAGAAAWDAARDAAWDAAWTAAGDAARNAAWDAAWDAAWAAAGDAARNAAGDAARGVLQPTVGSLQTSAIALFNMMIDPK